MKLTAAQDKTCLSIAGHLTEIANWKKTLTAAQLQNLDNARDNLLAMRPLPNPPPAPGPTPPGPTPTPTPTPPTPAPDPPVSGNWKPVLDDEFASLNPQVWTPGWAPSTGLIGPMGAGELECYDPTHLVTGNGLQIPLTAEPQSAGGVAYEYTSGLVTSRGKLYWQPGQYLEFDADCPMADGVIANWPAVWACTDEPHGPAAPGALEFDLMEGLTGVAAFHAHYLGQQSGGAYSVGTPSPGTHTYGAWWDAAASVIHPYFDGAADGPGLPVPSNSQPMFLLANYAIDNTYGGPHLVPAVLKVARVRIWQPA